MGAGGRDGRSVRVKQAPRRLRLGVLALSKAACGGSRSTTVLTDYLLSAQDSEVARQPSSKQSNMRWQQEDDGPDSLSAVRSAHEK